MKNLLTEPTDVVLDILEDIRTKKTTVDNKVLLDLFDATEDSNIRNTVSILLSDLQINEFVPLALKYIRENKNNRGSIVYSLQSFANNIDWEMDLDAFVQLALEGNYEEKCSSLDLMEQIQPDTISKETIQKSMLLIGKCQQCSSEIIADLLGILHSIIKS